MNGSFKHEVRLLNALRSRALTHSGIRILDVAVYRRSPSEDWGDRLQHFGLAAAERIHQLLTQDEVRVAGVGWGGTVANVVTALAVQQRPPRAVATTFIPTCGEMLGPEYTETSSSFLAKTLDEVINNGLEHHHSLAGIPAFIPVDATEAEADTIRKFIVYRGGGYQAIFTGPDPLIEKMDFILTSLASPSQPYKMYTEELQASSGVDQGDLTQHVLYDIGGVNIPRREDDDLVARWNKRWTGIQLQQYVTCARRATEQLKPGVVVVAIGKNKASLVLDAIDRGLVNTLLVDDDLADALIVALDQLPGVSRHG